MSELIPLTEISEILGIHINTLRKAVNSGELEAYNVGGFRTTKKAVEQYLEGKKVQPKQPVVK